MSFEKPGLSELLFEKWLLYGPPSIQIRRYVKGLGLKGHERVLEFGSGGGVCSRHLLKCLSKGGFLTCVDTSAAATARARRRLRKFSHIEFKTGKIDSLDIKDSSYDAVFIHYVLHDIPTRDRAGVLEHLARKLADKGLLLIGEPTDADHGIPAPEIRDLMEGAGLRETSFEMADSFYSGRFEKIPVANPK